MTAIQFDEMMAHTWSLPLHVEIRCAAEPFTHLNQEVVSSKNKMHQMGLLLWLKKNEKKAQNLWVWTFEVLSASESTADAYHYQEIQEGKISTFAWMQMRLLIPEEFQDNIAKCDHFHGWLTHLQSTFIVLSNTKYSSRWISTDKQTLKRIVFLYARTLFDLHHPHNRRLQATEEDIQALLGFTRWDQMYTSTVVSCVILAAGDAAYWHWAPRALTSLAI